MKRAIVTGATGAVGTALVKELAESGVEVLVFVRETSARNGNIPEHPLVRRISCSMEELADVQNPDGRDYDVFYHLAWAGASGPGRNDMYLQNRNVKYALDAVCAAQRFGCRLFVGAGSQAEYGRVEGKLTPDTPARPETGYGYAKLCAGLMTRDMARQLRMAHVWVRILSVYGPHDGAQTMIMSAIEKLKAGQVPAFTKAEQRWDYLYSGDAARALRLIGETGTCDAGPAAAAGPDGEQSSRSAEASPAGKQSAGSAAAGPDGQQNTGSAETSSDGKLNAGSVPPARVYVLGSGQARPLAEYIRELRDIVSPESRLDIGRLPYGPGQVMYLCADISALQADTGWQPATSFADGIRSML